MNEFKEWLTSGIWSYKKFKSKFNGKFNRKWDVATEYVAQIPYFKLILSPLLMEH